MKIAIMGAGAMGGFLGGFLTKAGCDVILINPPSEHARTIQENGLILLDGQETFRVPVRLYLSPPKIQPVQLVLIMVKSYDTEQAVKDALGLIGPDTYVLSLQNGIGHHLIMSKYVNRERILLGSTSSGAHLGDSGQVKIAGKGETFIGSLSEKQPVILNDIRDIFLKSGLQCSISHEILRKVWDKLIINVGINALTAITGLRNGQILDHPELVEILESAVSEAVIVARHKGIEPSFSDPAAKVKGVASLTATNKSSMLQDMENRKSTEIKAINGAIVEMGRESGLDVPVNRTLFNLIKAMERRKSNED